MPTGSDARSIHQKNNVKVIETTFLVVSFKKGKCNKFCWLIDWFIDLFIFLQCKGARRIQFQLHAGLLLGHLSQLTLKETPPLSSLPRLLKKWHDNLCDVDIQCYKTQDVSLPFTSSLSSTSVDIDRKTVNGLFLFFPRLNLIKNVLKW